MTQHSDHFFNRVNTVFFAVNHHVAVRADRNKVFDRVYNIVVFDLAKRFSVMHLDLPGKCCTVFLTEVDPADHAGEGLVRDFRDYLCGAELT